MNLSQVRELEDGDKVIFHLPFPAFTLGKEYQVRKTSVGRYVDDDRGFGWPLMTVLNFETHFKKREAKK